MSLFKTPRRRTTRQRSGFKVSGDKKGSTCKVETSTRIIPVHNEIILSTSVQNLKVPALFRRNFGIIGAGYYYFPHGKCENRNILTYENSKKESIEIAIRKTEDALWLRQGFSVEIPITQAVLKELSVTIKFKTSKPVDFFGLMLGAIEYDYLKNNDVYDAFLQKTHLYYPEIFYKDPTQKTSFSLMQGLISKRKGIAIICKSCNRCSRFLPIDIDNEQNTLAFSNHCISRAPCSHASFSQYKVESGSEFASGKVRDGVAFSHYGHQLECIVCKKFFVNHPLNPMRDSTQHREDSLRRRAFEVLVTHLLNKRWIYHIYRLTNKKEFDVAIWEKFGKKCFNCSKPLKSPNEMDLDHTLPLCYLWPLDETATCLCSTCNSSKSDKFPLDFYSKTKRQELSKITKLPMEILDKRAINEVAVKELKNQIVWFFDEFLANKDYQKIRKGKKAADLTLHALQNVLLASNYKLNLIDLYKIRTERYPATVTLEKEQKVISS